MPVPSHLPGNRREFGGLFVIAVLAAAMLPPSAAAAPPPEQVARYQAEQAKTILDLQQFRTTQSMLLPATGSGARRATLIDLHPAVGSWYLLLLDDGAGGKLQTFHLENASPGGQRLSLDPGVPGGVVVVKSSQRTPCALWGGGKGAPIDVARGSREPYVSLCDGAVYLRSQAKGYRTGIEQLTELVRDKIWGGEQIITTAREVLLQDKDLEKATLSGAGKGAITVAPAPGGPLPGLVDARFASTAIARGNLGIRLGVSADTRVTPGQWYPAAHHSGIYLSLVEPRAVEGSILSSDNKRVAALDNVEASALTYLMAFDLGRYQLGFALGTDHPRVGWSERAIPEVIARSLPGPDGIDDSSPLVRSGMVSPALRERLVATFTAGFKRSHGAFKYGPLAKVERGSHYGFMEQGVVFSKLRPGLSTLLVRADGGVEMKTWDAADAGRIGSIRDARQNGVALAQWAQGDALPGPGPLVAQWGAGNWSGSHEKSLRTMRAGACLQDSDAGRFLVYAVFTSATPSAMARVMQAYRCHHAMLLDMNALEHTYLALYTPQPPGPPIAHLIQGMSVVDRVKDGRTLARFVDYPDNRDLFYLVKRQQDGKGESQ